MQERNIMMIFSGSSNTQLAQEVATAIGGTLGKVELSRFANSEARVHITEKTIDPHVYVLQSLSNPTDFHVVEFCLLCDALKRMGAKTITAIIPWLGYSKQDKVFRSGEPLSVKVIANLLQTAPIDRVYTFDLHNAAITGFFDVPLINLSTRPLFLAYFQKYADNSALVVAPDAGAVKNATSFAQELGVDVAYIDKKRDLVTGDVTIQGISRDVQGKTVLMVDDIISTGATLIESAAFLKKHGAAAVRVGITHHLYVPGVQEKLESSAIDELIVANTIAKPSAVSAQKLKFISCASLIAKEMHE